MQLSQAKKKFIRALALKKNREREKMFVAEGEKVIADIMQGGHRPEYMVVQTGITSSIMSYGGTVYECDQAEMKALSSMATPPGVLAVFPQWQFGLEILSASNPRWLVADGIKDPGNMGTLIRTAHWFGVNAVIAINGCAELYNPKTIQSTMGSLGKLPVFYLEAATFFETYASKTTFYGADLEGAPLSSFGTQQSFALVIGSESHGLSSWSCKHISQKIYIPEFDASNRPESLNAAVSAGIILSRIAG